MDVLPITHAIDVPFKDDTILITKHFNIGQDRNIPIPGFFVIAPNRNIQSIDQMTDEEMQEFIRVTSYIRQGMRESLNIQEVCFYQDESAPHYHLRLFPRYILMEKFGKKIQSIRPIMERAKENMMNEETIKEVRESVTIMKTYIKYNPF